MNLNDKISINFFLVFVGYMVLGVLAFQTIQGISEGILNPLFFIPIFFFLSGASWIFGGFIGKTLREIRMESKREGITMGVVYAVKYLIEHQKLVKQRQQKKKQSKTKQNKTKVKKNGYEKI